MWTSRVQVAVAGAQVKRPTERVKRPINPHKETS
jgi:hypothetical protein